MTSFRVPREHQQKVLLIGITMALVLRTIFIVAGAAIIANFAWVFYVFGAFLIWTAIAQARSGTGHDEEWNENAVLRLTRRLFPTTDDYVGSKMTAKVDGKRFITPMLIVMVAIGSADLLFAVDSIPAIFAVTTDPFIVFTSNIFAILGLRSMYFLLAAVVHRFHLLKYGLAVILVFVGAKMLLEEFVHVPILVSLAVIVTVLTSAIGASLIWPKVEIELDILKPRGIGIDDKTGSIFGRFPRSRQTGTERRG
jgi:tellurite resistance protein TerC